jgi:DNA polymerase elongation subunit (family B)
MKTLVLDIETSPAVAYVWRFWQENVSAKQVLEHPYIMSFAAKWLDNEKVYYYENRHNDDKDLILNLIAFLEEADIVVAHNGDKFDLPKIRGRALVHGFRPPSPVKQIDTYKVAKKEFGFPSNSLEYLTIVLNCEVKKGGHKKFPGFELWLECLRGNEEAWQEMKEYNIDDVLALESLYLKLRPWITNHPNVSIQQTDNHPSCPKCNSGRVQFRGFAYTSVGKYHKFQCQDCGGWGRSRYSLLPKNENLLGNLVQ